MGFWHTGYIEFHESVGLDLDWFEPGPILYPCAVCNRKFRSLDLLRKHRFEEHPLQRPILILNGRELGTQKIRITSPLKSADISIHSADLARCNGEEIALSDFVSYISSQSTGVFKIQLSKDDSDANFTLEFKIAASKDLEGVEQQFLKLASQAKLDLQSIENFITQSEHFRSGGLYLNGICAYLYGVLAKERAETSNLKYGDYLSRYTVAVQELSGYDRPLAQSICALVEFHFNHFKESCAFSSDSRVGLAASRYRNWLLASSQGPENLDEENPVRHTIDSLLSDPITEQILQWSTQPIDKLVLSIAELESFLIKDIPEFDKKKVQILLAESYKASGNEMQALALAKNLRNLPVTEAWAESMIKNFDRS